MLEFLDRMERLEKRLDRALRIPPGSRPGRSRTELGLLEFVPHITPAFERPAHLQPLTSLIELAERNPIRALVSIPPRHSKTETILHAIAWWLCRHPERTVAYVTFADRLTKSKSRFARQYARAAGVKFADDAQTLNEWRTPEGGGAIFTSIGGTITGQGCHLLVVDDPHKDRAEAESEIVRDGVYDWFRGTALTRIEPGGSVIVCHTRWHPDDLIGRLVLADEAGEWKRIFLPAISETGHALWPSRWPLSELEKKRSGPTAVGDYEWASLYMGSPRPRGGSVFRGVQFYEQAPQQYEAAIGVDFAYTAKTYADWSVAVVLARVQQKRDNQQTGKSEIVPFYYVLDVRREQSEAPKFAAVLKQLRAAYPGAQMFSFIGGTEKGVVDFLKTQQDLARLHGEPAKQDKFVRAQPSAAAWNDGRIFLPRQAPWVSAFVSELAGFTGVADKHDDQVDALAGAYASLNTPRTRYALQPHGY